MKNFYLILSCCALFSLTAHSENFSGDDFNGAWEKATEVTRKYNP